MKAKGAIVFLILCAIPMVFLSCNSDLPMDPEKAMKEPKRFVGSDTCKQCHLEHYDSWKMTLHSRMTQDAKRNSDAILATIDAKKIRADIAKMADMLKVPADKVYIPKQEDIMYTNGSQWAQNYIVEKNGTLYVAPIKYKADTHEWTTYHEEDWDKRPWLEYCAGCHTTGTDLDKKTFAEPGVSCEACHGKGSWHAALPKTAVFEKRQTIINPAKLTMGVAVQICGSCHNRGHSTKNPAAEWPVGYEPGKSLAEYFTSTSYAGGDTVNVYANEFSKGHHQQYIDWTQSKHYQEGVTCTSCHYVHQIGLPPTRSQTLVAGSKQCFECHVMINKLSAHNIHSFANCIGCHMPRIATSAESGDIHSHVMICLLPKDTIKNPLIPNSCQACHKHRNHSLQKLQTAYQPVPSVLDAPESGGTGGGGGEFGEFGE
ncbi:MAG: multiheme c-type cytochrome [Desulfosalsimonadaceae bacterium]